MRWPGVVPAGSTPDLLANNVDIAPTMLALGGAPAPAPESMDGRSLLAALRTNRYKYIRYAELEGMDELYDLQADPDELHNLLPDRAPAGVREELSVRLNRMLKASSDPARR